jgi:uncharacterized small protein (DUF1192 family)
MKPTETEVQEMGTVLKEQVYGDQPELTHEQAVTNYLSDNETKINAIFWANHFESLFHGNWFTIEKIQKKTQFKTVQEAKAVLQVMCMLGICHASTVVATNAVYQKYKITLDIDKKVLLMKKEKERLEAEKVQAVNQLILNYNARIQSYQDEIARMEATVGINMTGIEFHEAMRLINTEEDSLQKGMVDELNKYAGTSETDILNRLSFDQLSPEVKAVIEKVKGNVKEIVADI